MKQVKNHINGFKQEQKSSEMTTIQRRPIMRIFMDERDLYKEEMLYEDIKKQIASFHPEDDEI